jgi:ribosomal protein S18 acetylase RimI-like enzyme
MAIEIREARPEEYEEAGKVTALAYREFVPAEGGDDWEDYLGRMADIAERAQRTRILVAVEDGRILGTVTLELDGRVGDWDGDPPLGPGEAHIRMLGVDPAARARGVGTRLMGAAQRMYQRLGYERTEDHVFPDGFVLLGYRKELSVSGSIS